MSRLHRQKLRRRARTQREELQPVAPLPEQRTPTAPQPAAKKKKTAKRSRRAKRARSRLDIAVT